MAILAPDQPLIIHAVDSLPAASKTYNAIGYANRGIRAGQKTLFAVPSTNLAAQIEKDCRERGCKAVIAIHGKNGSDGSVVARATKHFQETDPDRGEILIITQAALERLKFVERKAAWHLIIDEIPSPVHHEPIRLNRYRQELLNLLHEQPWNAAYTLLSASEVDTGFVLDVAENRADDAMVRVLANMANKLLSPHWQCYALNSQLARFRQPENPDTPNTLDFFGLLQPSIAEGFASVTLMGACLKELLLYRYWIAKGVQFIPHPKIKPRFEQYPNGHLVTIQYAIDRDWSGAVRDRPGVLDNIATRFKAALNGRPYVYLANKDVTLPSCLQDGVPLPHVSHGLNHFSTFHNAMLLSALNPPPAYFGFVSDMMGINSDELRTAIYRLGTLQAGARISIRVPDDPHEKLIQVVDRSTALWLQERIAQARVEKAPGDDPVPCDRRQISPAKSNADLIQASRAKVQQNLLLRLDQINRNPRQEILYIKDDLSRELAHFGTIFRDVYDTKGLATDEGYSALAFRNLLADMQTDVIVCKEDRCLISPGVYDPRLSPDTKKGLANLVSMSGIWLDNDGGDLAPHAFAKMLRVPLVVFNSFSATKASPRWRVWIPTSHLLTADVHREIIAQICKMLIGRKFYGKRYIDKVRKNDPDRADRIKHHGFDESKFTPASSFYLPSQAKAGPDASFFLDFNWQNDLLNPYQWVARSINDHREPTIVKPPVARSEGPQTDDEAKVNTAIANWRAHGQGDGNSGFFKLAVAFRHAGLGWFEAEPKLRYEAVFSHGSRSTADRLRDLKTYRRKIWGA